MGQSNAKLLISAARIIALLLCFIVALFVWIGLDRFTASIYQQYETEQLSLSQALTDDLRYSVNIGAELSRTLANSQGLREFASGQLGDRQADKIRTQLEQTYQRLIEQRPEIQQIRYIDNQGLERIRVDRTHEGIIVRYGSNLQFKGDRYYFSESINSVDSTWISPLDLNVENGQVERPIRPTVRAATKVIGDNGSRGILIINFDETSLINTLKQEIGGSDTWLINQDGYFILSPNNTEWGWILDKPEHNASATFDAVWQVLKGNRLENSHFINSNQYWASSIEPTLLGQTVDNTHYWLVSKVPDEIIQSINTARVIALLALIALLVLIFWTARFLEQLTNELVSERKIALEHSKAKAAFLARMSHEIRTPINGISGFIQLLEREQQSSQSRVFLSEAQGSLRILTTIINDILDMSKIEAGKMTLDKESFNLDSNVQTIGKIAGQLARGKAINLMFDFDPDRPRHLIGDPVRLQQILLNLVSNAIKFTDEGEVSVRIEVLDRSKGRVQLGVEVHDTGCGISKESLEQLFNPFQQGDHNDLKIHGGTGLGLSICQELVRMMQGQIQVDSEVGKGTTVSLNIWLEVDEQAEQRRVEETFDIHYNALIFSRHINTATVIRRQCAVLGWTSILINSHKTFEAFASDEAQSPTGTTVALIDEQFIEDPITADWVRAWLEERAEIKSILMISHNHDAYGSDELQYHNGFVVKPFTPSTLYDAVIETSGAESIDLVQKSDEELRLDEIQVLLAEDNPVNQMVATKLLESLGAEVTLAQDGKQAVHLVRQNPGQFDVLLMDMNMPNMDGPTAAQLIREDKAFDSLPIIALTANAMVEDKLKCLEAGMQEHIAKPFTAKQVSGIIHKHVHRIKTRDDLEDQPKAE